MFVGCEWSVMAETDAQSMPDKADDDISKTELRESKQALQTRIDFYRELTDSLRSKLHNQQSECDALSEEISYLQYDLQQRSMTLRMIKMEYDLPDEIEDHIDSVLKRAPLS